MKNVLKVLVTILIAIVVGAISILILYSLPTSLMYENAKESANLYGTEDRINNWADGKHYAKVDNYADAIMIMTAIYRPHDSVIKNAFLNPYCKFDDTEMGNNLYKYLKGETPDGFFNYDRYWHGYLLYLIPLLCFFNIGEIKIIWMFIQFLAIMFCLSELGKRNSMYMMLYAAVVLFLMPVTTAMSFHGGNVFILMLLFTAIILKFNGKLIIESGKYMILFAIDGILVSFTDLLTYPLIAFGVPLVTVFLINDFDTKTGLKALFGNSFAWCAGYLGMWIGKWILAFAFTGENVIEESAKQIAFRTQGDATLESAEGNTYIYALKSVWWVIRNPIFFALALYVVAVLAICYVQGKRIFSQKVQAGVLLPTILIAIVPFVWYFVVKNHSIIHPYLSYQELAISIWAIFVYLLRSIKQGEK